MFLVGVVPVHLLHIILLFASALLDAATMAISWSQETKYCIFLLCFRNLLA